MHRAQADVGAGRGGGCEGGAGLRADIQTTVGVSEFRVGNFDDGPQRWTLLEALRHRSGEFRIETWSTVPFGQ